MIRKALLNEFLHFWLTISSLVIAIIYFIVNPSVNILGLKDVLMFIILGMFMFFSSHVNIKPFVILFPLLIVLILSSVFSPAPVFATVASLRQLIVPFLLILCSYLATRTSFDYKNLIAKVHFNLWMLLIFGFAEKLIGFWKYINLTNFFLAKNIPLSPDNIPYVFIEPIGDGINRMVSLLLDPINLGHTLVLLLCLEIHMNAKQKLFRLILIFIGIFLTFCKGAYLQLFFIFIIFNTRINIGIRAVILVVMGITAIFLSAYHSGILLHFNGFIAAFDTISPFGSGMATAGNQSQMFAKTILKGEINQDIGDSFIGAVLGQIGVVGLFFWLLPFFQLTKTFGRNDIFRRVLLSQLVIACISENSFNLLSVYSICIIVGARLALFTEKKNDEKEKHIDYGSSGRKGRYGLLQRQLS